MKRALITGAGGFIGSHLVKRLKADGSWVRGIDLKCPQYGASAADEFTIGDLRNCEVARAAMADIEDVYQLAADMGGAGYLFTGEHDADVMRNSSLINLNMLEAARNVGCAKFFYSSSACIYPEYNQRDPNDPKCGEDSAYPAAPDTEYGWEKLFGERLYLAHMRNYGLEVRIARLHNVFGPECAWNGGREKAVAAICRKVAEAPAGSEIEIWGDGRQTRSFLYIDECLEGIRRLVESDFSGPVNIGSEEMVTINRLVETVMEIADKRLSIRHTPGPQGVRGRNSDNKLSSTRLGWQPSRPLREGLEKTYKWIAAQVNSTISMSTGTSAW